MAAVTQGKASGAGGAALDPRVPDNYTARLADLSFTVGKVDLLDEANWQILPGIKGKPCKDNVGPAVFEWGLVVTQGNPKKVSCSVKWTGMNLTDVSVDGGPNKGSKINVQVGLNHPGVVKTTGEEDEALQLPLAKHHETFTYVRLSIRFDRIKSAGGTDPDSKLTLLSHLLVHLTGNTVLNHQDRWHRVLRDDRHALDCETEAQLKALGVFDDVEIRTRRGANHRTLLVEVHRSRSTDVGKDEGVRYDPEKKLGQSYTVDKSSIFVKEEETFENFPCVGGAYSEEWQLDVSKETESERSKSKTLLFIGVIKNSFVKSKSGIQDFVGLTEEHVKLSFIFRDFQGDRMRRSNTRHEEDISQQSKHDHGFFTDIEKFQRLKPILPIDSLLGGLKCDTDDNKLVQDDVELPDEVMGKLNVSQQTFIKLAKQSKVSIAIGPPGTGKSTTVAALMRVLLRSKDTTKDDKVSVLAVTNVAVDAALESGIKFWQSLETGTDTLAPFVRVYSESSILRQWQDDRQKLASPYHLDSLRYAYAKANPSGFGAYLSGRDELQEYGRIDSESLYEGYTKEAKPLARLVLENSRAIFSTIATCQSGLLYQTDALSGAILWHYMATSIIVDEAGTCLRPHLMTAIMALPTAKRLVLAGDPYQLPPFVLSVGAKEVWVPSYLDDIIARGYPSEMINMQYRMHDELYAHLINIIYKKPIGSFRKTSDGSPFLQTLLRQPILAAARPGEVYKLRSFLHFLNVDHGVQVREDSGSSCNQQEADVVDSLVRTLVTRDGIDKKDIGVMTGYKAQKKLLWLKASANGWADVSFIGTIDSAQGSQYKIVVLSLVTTGGLPKFMGDSHRANVATSRQQEALYLVGHYPYWKQIPLVRGAWKFNKSAMHKIVADMASAQGSSFVVSRQHGMADQAVVLPALSADADIHEAEAAMPDAEAEAEVAETEAEMAELRIEAEAAEVEADISEVDRLERSYEDAKWAMEQTLQEEADAIANDPEIAELRQQETAKRADLQASNVPFDEDEVFAGSRTRLRQLNRDLEEIRMALEEDVKTLLQAWLAARDAAA
ncbi:MAG: hypothetical protein Q9193_000352 [Seirophora villosa]